MIDPYAQFVVPIVGEDFIEPEIIKDPIAFLHKISKERNRVTSAIVKCSREMAKSILSKQWSNRKIVKHAIKIYKQEINSGGWIISNQGLGFFEGKMFDGQHRLLGFLASDQEFCYLLCINVLDKKAQSITDVGTPRKLIQQLALAENRTVNAIEVSAINAATCLSVASGRSDQFTRERELRRFLDSGHRPAIEWTIQKYEALNTLTVTEKKKSWVWANVFRAREMYDKDDAMQQRILDFLEVGFELRPPRENEKWAWRLIKVVRGCIPPSSLKIRRDKVDYLRVNELLHLHMIDAEYNDRAKDIISRTEHFPFEEEVPFLAERVKAFSQELKVVRAKKMSSKISTEIEKSMVEHSVVPESTVLSGE